MTNTVQSVFSINASRRLIQFSAVIFTLFFIQLDAFAQKSYSFEFEGRQREYVVYLPQEFQPNLPVVFGFHGYRQGSNFISYSLLHEVADTAGFICIYPQSNPYWNTGLLYPGYPTIDTTVNDVGFISALIDTLYARYKIDMRRIYSCGFSHGGGMTNVLSGELSTRFAAVASVAGLFNDNSAVRYNPVRPFPILHIHGTEDIIETWDGSKANLWSVDSTINYKLEKNGCSLPGDTVLLPDLDNTDGCTVEKISYTSCSGVGQLIFYKILGGGHSWPSSAYTFSNEGNKNKDINANVEILNFFKKFENPLVYIPDTAFLYALIDEGVDTNGDSLISYAEAEALSNLDVHRKGISNMTGIEAFINIDTLDCSSNSQLVSLDVSECNNLKYLRCEGFFFGSWFSSLTTISINTELEYLYCYGNKLTTLDLSNCPSLKYLDCQKNQLTSLDVSNNTALIELYCLSNQLTSLNVSNSSGLIHLNCNENLITSLDVSNITTLIELHCQGNQLTSLDVSNSTALEFLYCDHNLLTSLDISSNSSLTILDCPRNQLTNLDVSNNTALTILGCDINQLTSLDISNNSKLSYLYISQMPTLYEVCVWTLPFPPAGLNLDMRSSPNVYFTTECSGNTEMKQRTAKGLSVYPNPTNDHVTIESILSEEHSIRITSLNGQLIHSEEMEGTTNQIDLSSRQKGIYFITIRSKDFITTKKIIKL